MNSYRTHVQYGTKVTLKELNISIRTQFFRDFFFCTINNILHTNEKLDLYHANRRQSL